MKSSNEIRKEIWKIVERQISKHIRPRTNTDLEANAEGELIRQRIEKDVLKLLNDNEAVLVYQP